MADDSSLKNPKARKKRVLRIRVKTFGKSIPLPITDVSRCGNHTQLPMGYHLAATIDLARNCRQMLIVNISALIIMVTMAVAGFFIQPVIPAIRMLRRHFYLLPALAAAHLAYIVLHELTHGLFMYALSGFPPSYGISLAYAFAGSRVWFDRKCHIIIALAPVIVWGTAFGLLCALLPPEWFWPIWTLQIANISGSAGDLFCVIFVARLKGRLLIQDTGTRMRVMSDANVFKSGVKI